VTTYLLKVSVCVVVFYVVYLFLFRQTNRLQLNRAFLVLGLLLSFLTPLIVLTFNPINISPAIADGHAIMDRLGSDEITRPLDSNYQFIGYLYYFGVIVSLAITSVSFLKPFTLYLSGEKLEHNLCTVIVHPNIQPFSFFGVLFIRSKNEDPMIVEHEMTHIKQRHWVDLILAEVAAIVLWFNPFIHFYRRSIIIQHEYIADRQVVKNVSIETYLDCIAKQLESTLYSNLTNSFNAQSIKQRIVMITNTKNYSATRYLAILPLVAVLIMAFAGREAKDVTVMQEIGFILPVDATRLKQGEGAVYGKRFNPKTNTDVFHTGVDLVLAAGNNVYAAAGGVVIKAEASGDYGNLIIIEHSNNLRTLSAHLESILVKAGDRVQVGHIIGTIGSTGLSTSPHLHFEVLKDGKAIDPVSYLGMRTK
jgi:hypothetical protein